MASALPYEDEEEHGDRFEGSTAAVATTAALGGDDSLSGSNESACDGHDLASPPRLENSVIRETKGVDDAANHRPPMRVIVVSSGAAEAELTGRKSTRKHVSGSSFSSPFATPFRLQPRKPMATQTAGNDIRGVKRSAQTMRSSTSSITVRDALLTSKLSPAESGEKTEDYETQGGLTEDETLSSHKSAFRIGATSTTSTPQRSNILKDSTPPKCSDGMGRIGMNFQCLSLQSPKPRRLSPPAELYPASPPKLSGAAPQLPSNAASPWKPPAARASSSHGAATNMKQTRSSFTTLRNLPSPCGSLHSVGSGSIGSNARMNTSATANSSCSGWSTKSSPKIALLTVLTDNGKEQITTKSTPCRNGNRPPLPGTVNSLWYSMEHSYTYNAEHLDTPKKDYRPTHPRTVHCRKPSSDIISTGHDSLMSPLHPRRSQHHGGVLLSPSAFMSPTAVSTKPCTPRNKQAKLDQLSSPSQRTPRTPLPKATLTPRSASNRNSEPSNGLPRFPSPSDWEMDVASPFSGTAAASLRQASKLDEEEGRMKKDLAAIRSLFPGSSNSLALSADGSANENRNQGGNSRTREFAPLAVLELPGSKNDRDPQDYDSREFFEGVQTRSLLTPSESGGIIRCMMEEKYSGAGDMDSVSDIDDDEGFVLASPHVLEEEHLATIQPARQRRRRLCDEFSFSNAEQDPAFSMNATPHSSPDGPNNVLAGVNYIASNASLFGMDIVHPSEDQDMSSAEVRCTPDLAIAHEWGIKDSALNPTLKSRKEHAALPLKRHKSDSSFASIGLALEGNKGDDGRDLVTPPPMPRALSPPPLSPREGYYNPAKAQEYCRLQSTNFCVAEADPQSFSKTIARMALGSQQHAENSPVLQT